MSLNEALENFIQQNDGATFKKAVESSTAAGFGGSGYSVELFADSTFRVLWNNEIGNLYVSPGVIMGIPQFDQETINDMQEYGDDADLSFALAEAEETLRQGFFLTMAEAVA